MAETTAELVTLVEVARLAGQKRSTVGNWKDRIENFPAPRDQGPRGPLYDRTEIVEWLEATGRLAQLPQIPQGGYASIAEMRGSLSSEEMLALLLMGSALRSEMSSKQWSQLVEADDQHQEGLFRESIATYLPFAVWMMPPKSVPLNFVRSLLRIAGDSSRKELAESGDGWIRMFTNGYQEQLPQQVVTLVIGFAGSGTTVLDPAAGTGQLLVAAGLASGEQFVNMTGEEQNRWSRGIALLNLKIHRLEANMLDGNSLVEDRAPELSADVIVTSPPWVQRLTMTEKMEGDVRWVWGDPGPGDANMAWVQHCLYHLAERGRAVIVLPPKVLFEQGRSARIRQGIIKAGYLEAVIALPPGLLRGTKIGLVVLVFAKGRRPVDGKSTTLMVNLEDQHTEKLGLEKRLPTSLVEEVLAQRQRVIDGHQPSVQYAALASYEAIVENGFDITPKRYVISTQVMISPIEFGEALKEARLSLRNSLEAGRLADRHLEQHLKMQS